MSRRREFARRLTALTDIAGILSAMRNLALMETRVLAELIPGQRRMVAGIETAAADFLAWHEAPAAAPADGPELCVLVGSEQGFCGDFNEALVDAHHARCAASGDAARWIVVGRRSAARFAELPDDAELLSGATVADEIPATLLRLTGAIGRRLAAEPAAGYGLTALYHCAASGGVRLRRLLPLRDLPPAAPHSNPVEIHLAPADLLAGLAHHFLHAALNEVLYSSLLAENRQRQAHMERALQRLDEKTDRLRRAANAQRQEDITEEIEILLLSDTAMKEESSA
jgi:F-type H+-transporting ATPase subunit gamma